MNLLLDRLGQHSATELALVMDSGAWDYGQLLEAAHLLAAWLKKKGATPGEMVAARGIPDSWCPVIVVALHMLGTGLALSPCPDVAAGGARWTLTPVRNDRPRAELTGELVRQCLGRGRRGDLDRVVRLHLSQSGEDAKGADGIVYHTSGSMGQPRVVYRAWHQVLAEVREYSRLLGLKPGQRVLCVTPLVYSYGFASAMLASMYSGAALCLCTQLIPKVIRKMLRQHPPDVMITAPQGMWLLSQIAQTATPVTAPRYVISSSAPLSPMVRQLIQDRWGWSIRQQYGTTETGAIAVDVSAEPDPTSVGTPLPQVEVDVTENKEIIVRSPFAASGYVCDAGRGQFAGDRFRTRDRGYFDTNGRLHVIGRMDDEVTLPSQKVSIRRMTDCLSQLPPVVSVSIRPQLTDGLMISLHIVAEVSESPEPARRAIQEALSQRFHKIAYSLSVVPVRG